jgi:hypothetical protein
MIFSNNDKKWGEFNNRLIDAATKMRKIVSNLVFNQKVEELIEK